MLHIPNDPKENELAKQIEALEEQVRHAEAHGQFDTAHHEMLRRLKQPKKAPKKEVTNG
jgi:hypothetical protein